MRQGGAIGNLRESSLDPAAVPPGAARGWRRPTGMAVGAVGLGLYNWWAVVAVHSHLLSSPDELFSDLEAVGRPDAAMLQRLDLVAGLVLITALLARGGRGPDGPRVEWPWLVAFAASGAVGGHFAYACPEGLSASCRATEWRLALPPHHYVHVAAGIAEFATATMAVYLAWQRTRPVERPTTLAIRWTGRALVVAYPLLGYAYLTDRLGALVEPVFFLCFSVMVLVELVETDHPVTKVNSDRSAGGGHAIISPRRPDERLGGLQGRSVLGSATSCGRTGPGPESAH